MGIERASILEHRWRAYKSWAIVIFFINSTLLLVLWSSWARGSRVWAAGGQRAALSTGCAYGP